jgi:hypothetical protein
MEMQIFSQQEEKYVGFVVKREDELLQCFHPVKSNHAHFISVCISMCCVQKF